MVVFMLSQNWPVLFRVALYTVMKWAPFLI